MMEQSKGKIFLSGERGHNETSHLRSYNTFNFGNFFNPYKSALGDLYVLNDDTLAGGHSIKMHIDQDAYLILIPVVGVIDYKDSYGNTSFVSAGEIQLTPVNKGCIVDITNPYEETLVNYLHLRIKSSNNGLLRLPLKVDFDITQYRNELLSITPTPGNGKNKIPFNISIVKLEGRREVIYKMRNSLHVFYAYVIEGAFEVQGRLLHSRDGLALWDVQDIEAEALSNDAILLVIELY
ncbi:MAG: pirin family protein [Agriterribacter sp.]